MKPGHSLSCVGGNTTSSESIRVPEQLSFRLVNDLFGIHSQSAYVPAARTLWKTQWILLVPTFGGLSPMRTFLVLLLHPSPSPHPVVRLGSHSL